MQTGQSLRVGSCPTCRSLTPRSHPVALSRQRRLQHGTPQRKLGDLQEVAEGAFWRHQLRTQAAAAPPAQQSVQLDVTKMSPLGDRLLVKPEDAKTTTPGGLLLTSGTTQPIQEAVIGKVLSVGEDVELEVKAGDQVIFSKYSSSDVKTPDGDICFVAQKSILAKLS